MEGMIKVFEPKIVTQGYVYKFSFQKLNDRLMKLLYLLRKTIYFN